MQNVNEEFDKDIVYGVFPYTKNKNELIEYPGLYVIIHPTLETAKTQLDRMMSLNKKIVGVEIMLTSKKEIDWQLIYSRWTT
jgi:hypothetical protein